MTKKFLTYEEAKEKADRCWRYEEGVYDYEINHKYTLVQHGRVLAEGVSDVCWIEKDVYLIKTQPHTEFFRIDENNYR